MELYSLKMVDELAHANQPRDNFEIGHTDQSYDHRIPKGIRARMYDRRY